MGQRKTKVCGNEQCKERKPLSEFYKRHSNRDGLERACKACKLEATRKRREALKAEAIPCIGDHCDGEGIAKYPVQGLCDVCNQWRLYSPCQTSSCLQPASGDDGMCRNHSDRGPCQKPGCDKRGQAKVKGVLLCHAHWKHAKGLHDPQSTDLSNKVHFGYIIRRADGTPCYVGITVRNITKRITAHRRGQKWWKASLIEPIEPAATFNTKAEAKAWEKATIEQFVAEGHQLHNTQLNPQRRAA